MLVSLVPLSSPLLIAGRTTTGVKLHWLQRQLNAFGIPSRNTSHPGAALCLEVPRERLEEARGLLSIVEGMPDDDARLSRRFWPLNMMGNLAPEQWARNEFKMEALASFIYRYFDLLEPVRFSVYDMVVHGSPVDHNHAGSEVERGILVSGGECFQLPEAEGASQGTWVRSGLYFLETGGLALSVAHGRYRPEGIFTTLLRLYVVVTPCVDFDMRAVAEGFAQRLSRAAAPAEAVKAARALAQVQDAPTPPPPPPGPSVEEKHAALAAIVTRYFHLLPKEPFLPEDFPDDEYSEVQASVSALMEGVPLCHGEAAYFPETPGAERGRWVLSYAFMCADGTYCYIGESGTYDATGITESEPRIVERMPGSDLPELDLTTAAQVLVEHLTRVQAPIEAVEAARALASLEAGEAPPLPPSGPSVEEKHAALAAVVTRYFHLLPKEHFQPEDFAGANGPVSSLMEGVPLTQGEVFCLPETPGADRGQWQRTHFFMCADATYCMSAQWGYYGPGGITHAEPRLVQREVSGDVGLLLDLLSISQVLVEHLTRARAPAEAVEAARALARLEAAPSAS